MQIRMGLFKYHFTLLFKVKVSPFTFGITFSQKPMQMKTGVFTVSITLPYCFKRKSQTPHFCDQFQSEANANENGRFSVWFYLTFQGKSQTPHCMEPTKVRFISGTKLLSHFSEDIIDVSFFWDRINAPFFWDNIDAPFFGTKLMPHFWDQIDAPCSRTKLMPHFLKQNCCPIFWGKINAPQNWCPNFLDKILRSHVFGQNIDAPFFGTKLMSHWPNKIRMIE